ncbi:MAG TPA: substrate-binding domain-containing protein [Geminicoccus sp.]|uniref:substrate-binding domain-containing protein n=1 Tax=Geminicoccus sp. TaxID=2024832 RepID=UPI002CBA134F|nr:substrate-binding domain-containing protein [Geminicoccus sp.]HWL69897.1 substrate-binding domain-containing protein [Geminicoccus sp.]
MCSSSLRLVLAGLLVLLTTASAPARELRVCSDPNNLPFSNEREEGFENRIVALLAKDLGATVSYTWWAQRRGFLRNTLLADQCDLVAGLPSAAEMVKVTPPYYRSSYVFVTRPDGPQIASLDDPALRELKIGVQLVGDDGANTPPAHALAKRGIVGNVRGYTLYGDYRQPNPPARIVEAVSQGEIDVAIVWGPTAGYFAARQTPPLRVTPVEPEVDGPILPMRFDISMGVRRDDLELWHEIAGALHRHRVEIGAILTAYGVPGAPPAPEAAEP